MTAVAATFGSPSILWNCRYTSNRRIFRRALRMKTGILYLRHHWHRTRRRLDLVLSEHSGATFSRELVIADVPPLFDPGPPAPRERSRHCTKLTKVNGSLRRGSTSASRTREFFERRGGNRDQEGVLPRSSGRQFACTPGGATGVTEQCESFCYTACGQ
jgi:hypothetical protein